MSSVVAILFDSRAGFWVCRHSSAMDKIPCSYFWPADLDLLRVWDGEWN